jgi:hypothetical protein
METVNDSVATTPSAINFGHTIGVDHSSLQQATAENAKLGDEYISLTFRESESSEDESSDQEEEEGDGEDDESQDTGIMAET